VNNNGKYYQGSVL